MVAVNDSGESSSKAEDEMEKNQTLQKDKNDCLMVSDTFHKVTNSSTSILLERGALAAGNPSLEPVLEMECQYSDTFELEHVQLPSKKLDPEAPYKLSSGRSTAFLQRI
ncbi:hypothetical protein POTOM_052700 [Populus tomentosa]|uniref:Uncharacterized protein n=1 Tax=Populus tomentosa TaxID=118781 RepID=A0A8X7Y429_POPTO|nr:hypothetical protein POTOM_052700 [Populus tomentosa]